MEQSYSFAKHHVEKQLKTFCSIFLTSFLIIRNQYIEGENGAYGAVQPDGTMNGLIGMVSRNEADAAVQGLGIFATRSRFAKPLVPTGTYE